MRTCKTCKTCKGLFERTKENFYAQTGGDGLTPNCKACVIERNNKRAAERMEADAYYKAYIHEYRRRKSKEHREQNRVSANGLDYNGKVRPNREFIDTTDMQPIYTKEGYLCGYVKD